MSGNQVFDMPGASEIFKRLRSVSRDEDLASFIFPRVGLELGGRSVTTREFVGAFFDANFAHSAEDLRVSLYRQLLRDLPDFVQLFTGDDEAVRLCRRIVASEHHQA